MRVRPRVSFDPVSGEESHLHHTALDIADFVSVISKGEGGCVITDFLEFVGSALTITDTIAIIDRTEDGDRHGREIE